MKSELKNFKLIPGVVKVDMESKNIMKSLDGIFKFYDDVIYSVTFIPQDESNVTMDEEMTLLGYEKQRKYIR